LGVAPSAVSIMPLSQSFGMVQQGMPSSSHTFTVTNTGGATTGALTTSIATAPEFAITADGCKGKTLAMNISCTITVVMTPGGLGTRNGTLTVTDPASGTSSTATLSGTGLAAAKLTVTPSPFTFPAGTAALATSLPQAFTVSNGGGIATGTITAAISGSD